MVDVIKQKIGLTFKKYGEYGSGIAAEIVRQ
jgi:hypothetical protein